MGKGIPSGNLTLFIKKFGIPQQEFMEEFDLSTNPSPTIMAKGLGGVSHSQYWLQQSIGGKMKTTTDKPPYRVPTMEEITAIPWNGHKVASTFSGCGGSCLGYRMAGFKVVWANEFVPAAQDSYNANKATDCYLDKRDIKAVKADEILSQTGLKKGELDLFDGSPPCQAFSTAGKRHKGWGKEKSYEHGAKQCNETLFNDYIRLVRGLMPKVFVAENVSGLVKGTAKGMFLEILRDLKACGYRVKCQVLDAQWLGVPQSRKRTIFVGVRDDLNLEPAHPKPMIYRYSVKDALPWVVEAKCRSGYESKTADRDMLSSPAPTIPASGADVYSSHHVEAEIIVGNNAFESVWGKPDVPNPTIMAGGANKQSGSIRYGTEKRKFTIAELKRICAFPDDFILKGSYAQQWERLGNSVPPVMMHHIAKTIRDEILTSGTQSKT
tara:strand:+ start:506 stop:1816 length:1311 start_codon:yes stop_codon:yes gene_type:complete